MSRRRVGSAVSTLHASHEFGMNSAWIWKLSYHLMVPQSDKDIGQEYRVIRRLRLAVFMPAVIGSLVGIGVLAVLAVEQSWPGVGGHRSPALLLLFTAPMAVCFGIAWPVYRLLYKAHRLPSPARSTGAVARWSIAAALAILAAIGMAWLIAVASGP